MLGIFARVRALMVATAIGLCLSSSAWAIGPEHADGPNAHDINWYEGLLGEKAGVEPNLLWRAPGRPVPFLALALNSLALFLILYGFGRRPVGEALKRRKARIMQGMEDAARMKQEAARRLAEYEERLERIEHEIERVKREMREAGEVERVRILHEARERRQRMERDAHLLIEQELKAVREELYRETVLSAVRSAESELMEQVSIADHQRLSREYLSQLRERAGNLRGRV